jgi:2-hydroxychromene-2-carboxylate isomerase
MQKSTMAMELDFFFFFGSTHSYLSVMRIEELAARAGVSVNWRPFSVRALMREQGNTFHTISPRTAYMWRDIERRAAEHGLPFVRPPIRPTDPDQLANRVGIVAASEGWCPAYAKASFRSWYLDAKELGDLAALSAMLRELGKAPEGVIARANSEAVRALYDSETDVARTLGVFGVPTFAVGQEIFWGDDRLEQALAWPAGRTPRSDDGAPARSPLRCPNRGVEIEQLPGLS